MLPKLKTIAFAAAIVTVLPAAADAAVTINISQAGKDVDVTASGTFDRSLSVQASTSTGFAESVNSILGSVGLGAQGSMTYYKATGPKSFGASGFGNASTYTGTGVLLNSYAGVFGVADSYVNGAAISSMSVFTNTTLASLGLTAGVYKYVVGGNAVTVNIGQSMTSAVPEPATWGMMLMGLGVLGFAMRRSRAARTTVRFA